MLKRGGDDCEPPLRIENLTVQFTTDSGMVEAVSDVSYDVHAGETLGVVGESGSGKTVSVLSSIGLIAQPPGRVVSGRALLSGRDLLALKPRKLRAVRGNDVSMIFQDPATSLNPVHTVGAQLVEAILAHSPRKEKQRAKDRAIDLLDLVGMPNAKQRFQQYPHEFSGGMRQRAMIAMAIANEPRVIIADEPTTALDVTIQAQVMRVLRRIQARMGTALILITHDLGLIAQMADRVVVMYAGRVVESSPVDVLFDHPKHPYTKGLMNSLPSGQGEAPEPIPGQPPDLIKMPRGCPFAPRCELRNGRNRCIDERPLLRVAPGPQHRSACHFFEEMPA